MSRANENLLFEKNLAQIFNAPTSMSSQHSPPHATVKEILIPTFKPKCVQLYNQIISEGGDFYTSC